MKLRDNIDYAKSLKKLIMDNNKYTPGPWKLQGPKKQEEMGGQTYWAISPDPYKSKADFNKQMCVGFYYPYCGLSIDEQKYNADLIASAPQLAEQNIQLKADSVKWYGKITEIKEILKKVDKGEISRPEEISSLIGAIVWETNPDDIPPTLFTQSVEGKEIDDSIENELIN